MRISEGVAFGYSHIACPPQDRTKKGGRPEKRGVLLVVSCDSFFDGFKACGLNTISIYDDFPGTGVVSAILQNQAISVAFSALCDILVHENTSQQSCSRLVGSLGGVVLDVLTIAIVGNAIDILGTQSNLDSFVLQSVAQSLCLGTAQNCVTKSTALASPVWRNLR